MENVELTFSYFALLVPETKSVTLTECETEERTTLLYKCRKEQSYLLYFVPSIFVQIMIYGLLMAQREKCQVQYLSMK